MSLEGKRKGRRGREELTGNVPCSWMCVRALIMSGIESASAQSQSSMPWDVGSLGEGSVKEDSINCQRNREIGQRSC